MNPGLRFRILARDGFTCRYCGARPPDVVLNVDHVIPKSKGGSDRWENLITACWPCNIGKRARLLTTELVTLLGIEPELAPPPRRITPPRTRAAMKRTTVRPLPVGFGKMFPYTTPDTPARQWTCRRCGFLCTLEQDACSCASAPENRVEERCWDCGESGELLDDGLCWNCLGYCSECRDEPRVEGEDYCAACGFEMAANSGAYAV